MKRFKMARKQRLYGKAREVLQDSLKYNPCNAILWQAWGQLEESQGNIAMARGHYVQGCKCRGGQGTVQLWQAWARMEEKQTHGGAALEVYHKAIMVFRKDSKLLVECAKLMTKMGQHAEAMTMLQRALDIDRYNPYPYQCLAKIESKLGNVAEARWLFATGAGMAETGLTVSMGSESAAASLPLIKDGDEGGKADESGAGVSVAAPVPVQGTAAGRRELAALLHEWAAFADAQNDDVNATRAIFQRALALDTQRGFMWRSFAAFEGNKGDPLVARHYFARAVNAEPHDGATWSAWAELELKLGNSDRAAFYARHGAELKSRSEVRSKRTDAARPLARKWSVNRRR